MRCWALAVFGLIATLGMGASVVSAATGRTPGTFEVSAQGAATYAIPIWTPPGPRGVQPSLALEYNSQRDNNSLGIGWALAGLSSIERCRRSQGQDGERGGVTLSSADRFCIDGNRLRSASGQYGAAGSTYFTEVANFSHITANEAVGSGPASFTVRRKDGLTYEYGGDDASRVVLGTSIFRWMLSRVSDRYGNNYVITYDRENGVALPLTISWTPTSDGASTYRYKAQFAYTAPRTASDSIRGYVAGHEMLNNRRLASVSIKSSDVTVRKYVLDYEIAPVTKRSRLWRVTECANDDETDCFSPTTMTYQVGALGVVAGGSTAAGFPYRSSYDFNADGKDDLVYGSSGSVFVALSSNAGFEPARNTGASGQFAIGAFLAKDKDGLLVNESGTLFHSRWDEASASFIKTTTGASFPAGIAPEAADVDGDGLADLVWLQSTAQQPNSVFIRRNITAAGSTVPSFAAAVLGARLDNTAWFGPGNQTWSAVEVKTEQAQGMGLRHYDVNGDGRQDLHVGAMVMTTPTSATYYSFTMLSRSSYFFVPAASAWVQGGQNAALHFNDDACTDRWGKQIGTSGVLTDTIYVSRCDGLPAYRLEVPGSPSTSVVKILDWDGDGRSDLLVNNGGSLAVRRSVGAGFAALETTSLANGDYFSFDKDGDGREDLALFDGASTISYYTPDDRWIGHSLRHGHSRSARISNGWIRHCAHC